MQVFVKKNQKNGTKFIYLRDMDGNIIKGKLRILQIDE